MRCVKPFVRGEAAYGCGQCMPCRFNKQRVWYHRILLEGLTHVEKCFVTLTYREEELPSDRSVSPEELRDWLKRFRKSFSDRRLRYFAVGEYGERGGRPHYHAILYGVSCGLGPYTVRSHLPNVALECSCRTCTSLRATWRKGHVTVGSFNLERAKYISGYVLKKMTTVGDLRLDGRHPEFARMSTHPGLGFEYMKKVAVEMRRHRLTLPNSLAYANRRLPLGRYLRSKLAGFAGVEVPDYKDTSLLAVRSFAWAADRSVSSVFSEVWAEYEASLLNKIRVAYEKKQTQAISL